MGRQLGALASSLVDLGARFHVLLLQRPGKGRPPLAEYLEGIGVSCGVVEDRGPLDFGLVRRTAELLDGEAPSVVQSHGYKATAVVWALRRTGAKWPWVGFFHGETHENLKARVYHWLDHKMLGAADRVAVMSKPQLARFARLGSRVRIIHNAVLPDPGTAGPDDSDRIRAATLGRARPILGVVGRLSPEKGVDVFLEACAVLEREGRPFSALIAGDGSERERLESHIARLGLEERVQMLGPVRNVSTLYRVIDLLVIPSKSEGLPNVLLEAIGADLPVVATAVGAVSEVLGDERAGIIVPPGDPVALAAGITAAGPLIELPAARTARADIAAAFSVQRRVERLVDLYAELTADAVGPRAPAKSDT